MNGVENMGWYKSVGLYVTNTCVYMATCVYYKIMDYSTNNENKFLKKEQFKKEIIFNYKESKLEVLTTKKNNNLVATSKIVQASKLKVKSE